MALGQELQVPSLNSLQGRIAKLLTFEITVCNRSNSSLAGTLKMMLLGGRLKACKLNTCC